MFAALQTSCHSTSSPLLSLAYLLQAAFCVTTNVSSRVSPDSSREHSSRHKGSDHDPPGAFSYSMCTVWSSLLLYLPRTVPGDSPFISGMGVFSHSYPATCGSLSKLVS